jgi:ABC-2 type transport system permease protein
VTDLLRDHVVLLGRSYRLLRRQPIWVGIMLVQPLVWLLLYSQLFGKLPRLGGFGTSSYLEFLTPGIAILIAFSHGAWEGGGVVQDIERGAIDRFLATPLPPSALLISRALHAAIASTLQAFVIVAVAIAFGARLHGGFPGLLAILAAAALVCVAFAAFSHALALLFRRQETMIAFGQFVVLPLMFTSVMLTAAAQMPAWIRRVATANPVNWAVEAARSAMLGTDWSSVMVHLGGLAALVVAMEAFALLALARYRRSL